jgi:glycosyltransferase involved in cell wall biosynthesis
VPCHVHVEHGAELADLRLGFLKRKLRGMAMRWAFRRVDGLVSVCDGVTRLLTYRCGYPAQRVRQIPNGVEAPPGARDPAERSRVRAALGAVPETCVVGSVGRLAPVKDFGTAVEAVARLVREGRDVHLLLVGDGPERSALVERAEARGMASRTHLVGEQGRVGPWLAAMDVYVNSSLSEGMSLSILEGMSAGLPLVVTDVGENAALLGEGPEAGLVVAPGSPEELAAAVARLAGDPPLRGRLGRMARARFEQHYTIRDMVSRYEDLYRALLSVKPSAITGSPNT